MFNGQEIGIGLPKRRERERERERERKDPRNGGHIEWNIVVTGHKVYEFIGYSRESMRYSFSLPWKE